MKFFDSRDPSLVLEFLFQKNLILIGRQGTLHNPLESWEIIVKTLKIQPRNIWSYVSLFDLYGLGVKFFKSPKVLCQKSLLKAKNL